jgi:GGDEF domain-containing protein
MTRAKAKRAGTKGGNGGRKLPTDLTEAAEVALDDLLREDEIEDDEILTMHAAGVYEDHTQRRARVAPPEDQMSESGTMPIDAEPIDDIDGDEVITELPVLRVGVFEDATHLRSLQSAVGAAGHTITVAATGKAGRQQVLASVRAGELDAVIVALPGGEPIIDAALAVETQRPVVIASVEAAPLVAINRASVAGADLVTIRPHDVGTIAPVMLAANRLTIERKLAADPEPRGLVSYEAFQRVLELAIVRAQKLDYPLSVALFAIDLATPPPAGIGGIVRARAGNAVVHSIREIDVATQLEGDRFLVMLPYTDLKRAAALAQKVVAAVKDGEPVMSAGRAYPPRITGAAVAAKLSQPVSFARLLKDAMQTLEQARKDGADLAVQP